MKIIFKILIILISLYKHELLFAQDNLQFHFQIIFQDHALQKDSLYILSKNDSLRIESLKFYISAIEVYFESGNKYIEKNSYHLIDFEDENTLRINLKNVPKNKIRFIKFNIGIDSITNVSGAMGGDLDPTKGMYWTWQNGYINFKLEGWCNVCPTRQNQFQFHLGGYHYPFNTLQTVELPIMNKESITLVFDIEKLIRFLDFGELNHIMSPQKEAVTISNKLPMCFSIQ